LDNNQKRQIQYKRSGGNKNGQEKQKVGKTREDIDFSFFSTFLT